ncbi:MAG: hypothetical protein Q4C87_07030 [Actinomycetaceae bacterium]|nr:hypothetical protein [Actinomycetaceae bacterium]
MMMFASSKTVNLALLATLTLICSACFQYAPDATDVARPELLTVNEVMAGSGEVLPEPVWGRATGCNPDGGLVPRIPFEAPAPNMISFAQGDRSVTVAVWEDDDGMYARDVININKKIRDPICLLGSDGSSGSPKGERSHLDWRVFPLDFGEGTAAFRSVQWSSPPGSPAPPEPISAEGIHFYSAAQAYGIVQGKFVMVIIATTSSEPPSEKELRALWDAQVAKVRFHDAVVRNHEVQSSQSGSVNAPVSW